MSAAQDKQEKHSRPGRILDRVNSMAPLVTGAMFILIMLVMVREVVGRYLFNNPLIMVEDITTQLQLLAVFWGASYVMSINGFAMVDIFYRKFSPLRKAFVDLVGYLAGLAFLSVLFWMITNLAIRAYVLKTRTTSPAMIPYVIPYAGMLIGLFFFVLQTCRQALRTVFYIGRNLKRMVP